MVLRVTPCDNKWFNTKSFCVTTSKSTKQKFSNQLRSFWFIKCVTTSQKFESNIWVTNFPTKYWGAFDSLCVCDNKPDQMIVQCPLVQKSICSALRIIHNHYQNALKGSFIPLSCILPRIAQSWYTKLQYILIWLWVWRAFERAEISLGDAACAY